MLVLIKRSKTGDMTERCQVGGQKNQAFLLNISRLTGIPLIIQTFDILFSKQYIEAVIIRETNKK